MNNNDSIFTMDGRLYLLDNWHISKTVLVSFHTPVKSQPLDKSHSRNYLSVFAGICDKCISELSVPGLWLPSLPSLQVVSFIIV